MRFDWDASDKTHLTDRIDSLFRSKSGRGKKYIQSVFSIVVAFVIFAALITPAIATTGILNAGEEEEISTEAADAEYDGKTVPTGHVHTDACYEIIRELTCGQEESEGHVHTAECYAVQEEQASAGGTNGSMADGGNGIEAGNSADGGIGTDSGSAASDGADAGSETAATEHRLICGMEEHVHNDACYGEAVQESGTDSSTDQAAPVTERILVCGYEDGQEIVPAQYSDPVYGDPVVDEETGEILEEAPLLEEAHLVSEAVIHYHSDACYEEIITVSEAETPGDTETGNAAGTASGERPLICGLPEHIHTDACYEEVIVSTGNRDSTGSAEEQTAYATGAEQGAAVPETTASDTAQGTLICGMEEGEGAHKHDDSCYTERRVLICGMEEGEFTEEELALLEELKKKEEEEKAAAESTVFFEKTVQYTDDEDLRVTVTAPEGAFPANTEMIVEIIEDEETLTAITDAVDTAEAEIADSEESGSGDSVPNNANNGLAPVPSDAEERPVRTVRAVDITFRNEDGEEIEPALPITVVMASTVIEESDRSAVVHVDSEGQTEILDQIDQEQSEVELAGDEVAFESDKFSIYAVVGTIIEKYVLASDGNNYKVTVTFRPETEIPANAELLVEEILPAEELEDGETDVWQEYASMVAEALGWGSESASYLRLFDIKIVDKDGVKIQPAEGSKVDVRIELADKDCSGEAAENTTVVHFTDDADEPDVMQDVIVDGTMISFATEGFSAYAIVEGPSQKNIDIIDSLDELADNTNEAFFLSYGSSPIYFTNDMNSNGCFIETAANDYVRADEWYFKKVSDENNALYHIYTKVNNEIRYVSNPNGNLAELTPETGSAAVFVLSPAGSGKFYFKLNEEGKWLQHSGSGNGIRFYTDNKNATNSQIKIAYASSFIIPDDPYGFDGMSFGLMTWNGGKTAKALMASENSGTDEEDNPYSGCLEAKFLTLMSNESNSNDKLYVPNNTADTVTDWTFEWQDEDIYYLKGKDGSGADKYLSITAEGLFLADEPNDSCLIQVVPGSAGIHKGQISLKSATGGQTLTYSGKYAQGFDIGGAAGSEWLYLVEGKPEELLTEYVKVYSATKVSISDTERVYTGQKVIIYTREWKNDHYEYYAINSKGELVPCEESGDSIEWVGGNLNDMLWQFTEYTYEGTDTPNGYYELQNLYAKSNNDPSYLAPKYSEADNIRGILSEDTVGILMEGRQNKQYYSTIDAWDTPEYMYSSLMVDMSESDPTIKPCVSRDGLDFYFAIMEDLPVDDVLHTVPTVNNDQFGIKMIMYDLSNGKTNDLTGQMNAFLNNGTANGMTTQHTPGLLSTNLVNGYPTAEGGPLSVLFGKGDRVEANHLFIESTYRATGYYEYNSTQNFAYLTESGDFRVYKELGTNDTQSKNTLKHGQFFPYNDILPGQFASANGENLYSATGSLLPDSDPRKHEQLYLVDGTTDYYYAMELEASFIQTPSGLDAWGHDIIFEFSGDDDFWLYVDNELVIDLGGIHSAVPGSVNFRTGEVNVNGTPTTLYDLFYNNYLHRDNHTEADALAYVDSIFEVNSSGQHVFKDDTPHTMRIFYMERGAGASNLHMKFNLATVKKGTVQLNKKLDGVEESETSYAVFPYQIFYTMENDPPDTEWMLRNTFNPADMTEEYIREFSAVPESTDYVYYMDSAQPVTFQPELKIGDATYYNVFMLKPGETADINFPVIREDPEGEEITVSQYRIVECGVDPSVYTQVKVNDQVNDGTPNNYNHNIRDYDTGWATTDDRPKVKYVNKVENLQSLDITKELYKKLDGNDSPQKIELYDSNGDYLTSSDVLGIEDSDLVTARNAVFNYRLYFKTSNDNDFSEANRFIYHVKDPAGYYCRWDSTQNAFVRITNSDPEHYYPDGTQDYSQLTDDYKDENGHTVHQDKFWSSFETGTHGSISGIPAYYTIEIRDLVPGTQYMIVERPSETDDGYKFWQYESRDTNQQAVTHTDTDPYDPMLGISGTIQASGKSEAWVRNYKGYGIRLKKIWEDASIVKDRDPAYFAVYRVDAVGSPEELEPNSVRRLDYGTKPQELYWWYLTLPFRDTALLDYSVFEVKLEGEYTVLPDGSVTVNPGNVEPVLHGGLNTLNVTLNGQNTPRPTRYTVTYEIEENENGADNVLVVKATNAPTDLPPVQFIKRDWGDSPLPGAVFSLKDNESSVFDTETKTSDTEGLIGQVYLQEGVTYTLTEETAPQGFIGLNRQLKVRLESTTSGWTLNVSPEIPSGYPRDYEVTEVEGTLSLIVRNRPYRLEMVKHDSTDSRVKLAGAIFSLYRQQSIGNQQTWDENNPVFTDLTTNGDGVIPAINSSLPAGTYQLRETQAPDGYIPLTSSEYINFTVTQQGVIELGTHSEEVTFTTTTDEQTGICTYTVGIPNHPQPIEIIKTDEAGNNLTGAQFHLRKRSDTGIWVYLKGPEDEDLYKPIDMTAISVYEINDLPVGSYCLTETYPPDGYIISVKDHYFIIEVTTSGGTAVRTVSLCDEDGNKVTKNEWGNATLSKDDSSGIYTITIKNTPGEELPMTGGPGRGIYAFLGMLLIAAAGVLLLRPGRRLI